MASQTPIIDISDDAINDFKKIEPEASGKTDKEIRVTLRAVIADSEWVKKEGKFDVRKSGRFHLLTQDGELVRVIKC